jgi:hypothetical protein
MIAAAMPMAASLPPAPPSSAPPTAATSGRA